MDRESQFRNDFVNLAANGGADVQRAGVEAHFSLGIRERSHQPLHATYRKVKIAHPNISSELALSMSVKAMNGTLKPEGIVPSALVSGDFPSVRTRSEPKVPRATLEEREW